MRKLTHDSPFAAIIELYGDFDEDTAASGVTNFFAGLCFALAHRAEAQAVLDSAPVDPPPAMILADTARLIAQRAALQKRNRDRPDFPNRKG